MNVPAAVDELLVRTRAALDAAGMGANDPLRGVEVFNGPDPGQATAPRAVTIGAPFQVDQEAVTVTREERGASLRVAVEAMVACSVYVGSGDIEFAGHRDAAGEILDVVRAMIAADRQLGGTVSLARLTAEQWMQSADDMGSGVAVGFVVSLRFLP